MCFRYGSLQSGKLHSTVALASIVGELSTAPARGDSGSAPPRWDLRAISARSEMSRRNCRSGGRAGRGEEGARSFSTCGECRSSLSRSARRGKCVTFQIQCGETGLPGMSLPSAPERTRRASCRGRRSRRSRSARSPPGRPPWTPRPESRAVHAGVSSDQGPGGWVYSSKPRGPNGSKNTGHHVAHHLHSHL